MKRFLIMLLFVAASFFLMACDGKDGGNGPLGPSGIDGADGADGSDGSDGKVDCPIPGQVFALTPALLEDGQGNQYWICQDVEE